MSTYLTEKKRGNTYERVLAQCQHCLGTEIEKINDKYICVHCGKEYIINEMH